MPKLLQINASSNWGSTGKIAEQIGLFAQNCGWDSYIAYGRNGNLSHLKNIKIGTIFDVYEHYIENRFFDREGLASRKATLNFLKQVDEIKPDIVHLHNIHGHYLNYKYLFDYLQQRNIPTVYTLHDCWAFTGHCYYFDTVHCEKWKTECFSCKLKSKYAFDRSIQNYRLKKQYLSSLRNLTIVPVSNWLCELVKESFLKDQKICVIKNGIDLKSFNPQIKEEIRNKYGIKKEKLIIGCASIWSVRKGLEDFMQIRKLLPVSEYKIILVGLNKKQMSILPNGLIGIERTNSVSDLAILYSIADVFVNPTYSDNYPTTNLEAMACGTPVITYKTGGSPEAVDEKTGIVVNKGDIYGLVAAIKEITNISFEDKNKLGKFCRERALMNFDKNKCFESYMALYNKVLVE